MADKSVEVSSIVNPLGSMNLESSSETNGNSVTAKEDTAITALEGMCHFLYLIGDLFTISQFFYKKDSNKANKIIVAYKLVSNRSY
jgi:hypothetical protein